MYDLKWSPSEKKIARRAYEAALDAALSGIMAEFKAKVAAAVTPSDMWAIEDYLRVRRREIDELFDYRYSQLPFVFARLIRDGHLDEARLAGCQKKNWRSFATCCPEAHPTAAALNRPSPRQLRTDSHVGEKRFSICRVTCASPPTGQNPAALLRLRDARTVLPLLRASALRYLTCSMNARSLGKT